MCVCPSSTPSNKSKILIKCFNFKSSEASIFNYDFINDEYKQLFTSQEVNWWTGVIWITCGLLWCFYQLFGLSFWRHPFTPEDPLVNKRCDAKFLQNCSNEETNSSTSCMSWRWVNLKKIIFFGWTFIISEVFLEIRNFWQCEILESKLLKHTFHTQTNLLGLLTTSSTVIEI